MSKNVAGVRVVEPDDVPATSGLPDEVTVTLADIATVAREGLLALSVSTGLAVMTEMMEAEITQIVGPKHAKLPDRTASRHTGATTSVVLGGRKVPIVRPRARTVDNTEVQLDTFATFANEDVLNQVVLERMLAGVATRRHRARPSRSAPPWRPRRGRRRSRACRAGSSRPPASRSSSCWPAT